jgi:hypothetical protein
MMNFGFFDLPRAYLQDNDLALQIFGGVVVYSAGARPQTDSVAYMAKSAQFSEHMERYEPVVVAIPCTAPEIVDKWADPILHRKWVFRGWRKAHEQGITVAKPVRVE